MTEPLKRGLVKPDEEFAIDILPGGERFKTILLASGNTQEDWEQDQTIARKLKL